MAKFKRLPPLGWLIGYFHDKFGGGYRRAGGNKPNGRREGLNGLNVLREREVCVVSQIDHEPSPYEYICRNWNEEKSVELDWFSVITATTKDKVRRCGRRVSYARKERSHAVSYLGSRILCRIESP
ncbi:MAG: hypothetical protein V9E86_10320 [Nitrosomonas sp.]